jgi:hypothetical protein
MVYVSPRDDYHGYPTGMGSRQLMSTEDLRHGSSHLVELGSDWFGTFNGAQVMQSRIICMRPKSITPLQPTADLDNWAKWPGGVFSHVYTDGSHAEDRTIEQLLLGHSNKTAGGAIILSDGESWVHRIFVEIDVEVTSAFEVELICIANEMSVAMGGRVVIRSDCSSAIKTANGGYSEVFF